MGRKSKAITVPEHTKIDEQQSDELIEIHFKKLMQETKTKRYKVCMKHVAEKFNPNDFGPVKSLAKTLRKLIIVLYIEICELEKQRDEAQLKLRKYENGVETLD